LCQLTYTHRIGWYHNFAKRWIDYQPKYIQSIPEYNIENNSVKIQISMDETFMERGNFTIPKDITFKHYKILTEMYKTWLQYVYDEDEMFNYLLYKIDTLKSYTDLTNNEIKFIYWPDIQNDTQLSEIKNRNFFNIDNEYSMLKWSVKNKLTDETSHLTKKGHLLFTKLLNQKISNKVNKLKKNLYI
jgi:hypothetical protein